MEIVAFLGSPRHEGNTHLLLQEAIRGAEEVGSAVRVFTLNLMRIKPCQNCGGCDATGECIHRDDMDQIYAAIRSAPRIILASPVFFAGLTAQTKAMVDRCQAFWCEKYLLNRAIPAGPEGRRGLLLTVGGMKTGRGVECAGVSATAFFRTVSVAEHAVLSYRGVDAKGAIREHPTALADALAAGRALAGVPG